MHWLLLILVLLFVLFVLPCPPCSQDIFSKVDKSGEGVCVQASTLGSLEALLSFLDSGGCAVFPGCNFGGAGGGGFVGGGGPNRVDTPIHCCSQDMSAPVLGGFNDAALAMRSCPC